MKQVRVFMLTVGVLAALYTAGYCMYRCSGLFKWPKWSDGSHGVLILSDTPPRRFLFRLFYPCIMVDPTLSEKNAK